MESTQSLAALQPADGVYPWQSDDPWVRLTSEVLLSRTRRTVVARVYSDFINTWPTARELAAASPDKVWQTIRQTGFRRRAHQLVAIGRAVKQAGRVPDQRMELLELPGIGDYAADAVRILAFDGDRMPLDMNVNRVVSRIAGIAETPGGRSPYRNEELVTAAGKLMSGTISQRRAVFTGILELSAQTCRPDPRCDECPLASACEFAHSAGRSEMLSRDGGG